MTSLRRITLVKRSNRGGHRIRRGGRQRARMPRGRVLLLALVSLLLLPLLRDRSQMRPESEAVAASDTVRTDGFPQIAILRYGHVAADPRAGSAAVPADTLRAQIRRARKAGWKFVPLSELIARRDHPEELPPRTMVVTFDDGYRSFEDRALPVLREEGVSATISIVDQFVEHPPSSVPTTMSWRDIYALDRTDDVSVASQTHALHQRLACDPQGDETPSVTTRRWDARDGRYEDGDAYVERIRRDMRNARAMLRTQLGRDVHVLAWPWGEHNRAARELAAEMGFTTTLALGNRLVTRADLESGVLPRFLVTRDMVVGGRDGAWMRPPQPALCAAQVDLDAVYSDDPATFAHSAEALVKEVRRIGATHVFLQACPDPQGDGYLDQTWFMNDQTTVRADIWSAVASKLHRAGIKVWVRAPSMNLSWAWQRHPEWRIPFHGSRRGTTPWYFRVSPDLPDARQAAMAFYTDLAVHLPIDGVLFDDDAYMLPGERLAGGGASDPDAESAAIRGYLDGIEQAVRAWRPDCVFGRNLYAPVVEHSGVSPQFAQDFDESLTHDDLTVVMAYPYREGHGGDAARWVGGLARIAERRWGGTHGRRMPPAVLGTYPSILFELQAYDWEKENWVDGKDVLAAAREVRRDGIAHVGVYPVIAGEGDLPDGLLQVPGAPAPASNAAQVALR